MDNYRNNFANIEKKFQKTKRLRNNFTKYKTERDTNIKLIIKLERWNKNNRNPEYVLSIFGNGKVTYNGVKNVRIVGYKEASINIEQLMKILEELENIYFFSLDENYVSDLPHDHDKDLVKVSVTLEDDAKEILFSNDRSAPGQLIHLADLIDDTTNSAQWIR